MSSYSDARKALSQHMWHHHNKATGSGRLENRLEEHDTLHFLLTERGYVVGHIHEPLGESESIEELCHRYLLEGENQDGTRNPSERQGSAPTVDSGSGDG